jgi:hypothetical protein
MVLRVLLLVYRIVGGVDNSLCYMVRFYPCPLPCLGGEALLQLKTKGKKCEYFFFLLYICPIFLFFSFLIRFIGFFLLTCFLV